MTPRSFALTLGVVLLAGAQQAEAAYQQRMFDVIDTDTQSGILIRTAEPEASTGMTITPVMDEPEAPLETMFVPSNSAILSRAEFTALIVEKMYNQAELDRCFWDIASKFPPGFSLVFTDVNVNDRFAKQICVAMRDGIVRGYVDGSFRPDRPVNAAESAKILSRAYSLAPYAHLDTVAPWYEAHVKALASRNAIPESITRLDQQVNGAQAQEMLARLAEGITTRPARRYEDLMPKPVVKPKPAAASTPKPTVSAPKSSAATSNAAASSAAASAVSSKKKSIWNPF